MIASGTPREVAISESTLATMTDDDIKRTGATPEMQAKVKKRRDAKLAKEKGGAIVKLTPQEKSKKRTADAKKKQDSLAAQRKEIMDRKKVERLRRSKHKTRNALANAITKASYSKANTQLITKDEGGATAAQKAVGNLAKTGAATTKNVAKGLAKAVVGVRDLRRARKDRKAARDLYDVEKKQYDKDYPKKMKEEFIQEVEDKKDSKAKKVIDIMKGKNPIKINPDVKEDTVVVQDASGKDFVEIVDIITPEKIRSDWRKEINVTEASAAWTRKEGKKKSGGLNEKGRKSYERQNPGSDLKAPSKKVGNPRRKSFCARMKGMKKKLTSKKTARDPDSRINKSLRAWNC